MHSSIGTRSLAYPVGPKVMDMRSSTKDERQRETIVKSRQSSIDNTANIENSCDLSNNCTDMSRAGQRESSTDPTDLVTLRVSTDGAARDSSSFIPNPGLCSSSSSKVGREYHRPHFITETYIDFPPLPVIDLFDGGEDENYFVPYEDESMHGFQINDNSELIMEPNTFSPSSNFSRHFNSEIKLVIPDMCQSVSESSNLGHKTKIVNRLRISDVSKTPSANATTSKEGAANEPHLKKEQQMRLWNLHQIVVDVVRTDSHLEVYKDTRNLARMSDMLAVYAWVDPATGYCQGMIDLLSPFVVLLEDNAEAFWCLEMLIRRLSENFQMEGPSRVMKQLQALWHILRLTDREMFAHLSNIGAESLHFAFPMLLVLFRRELSFNKALCMWEMIWAADFDQSLAHNLEENRLGALII